VLRALVAVAVAGASTTSPGTGSAPLLQDAEGGISGAHGAESR